jgi:hypothetical protein
MHARRSFLIGGMLSIAAVTFALGGCGSDGTAAPVTTPPATEPATTQPGTTVAPTTIAPTTVAPTTSTEPPTTEPAAPEQPAIWPAAGTVFTTPEAAAADFVESVLGVPAVLGPFEAGDQRSGEIAVYSPGEGSEPVERGLLILRRLAPDDGWFVLAAAHDTSTVTTPVAGSTVPAGPITVSGLGHGFEASMTVSARIAGVAEPIDAEHTMAGSMEDPGTYTVELDLTGVSPGTVVMLLVQGGTGLETDPGEFGAIAVVVGSAA